MHVTTKLCGLATLLLLAAPAMAENWPNWRGPTSTGVASGSGYPTTWGESENVVWKVKLPGWGTSTPAIWGQRIFLSSDDDQKNALLCLDRQGKTQWTVHFGPVSDNKNRKAGSANPSPVTDGEFVYAYYKSGDLACVSVTGDIVWQINLQEKYGPDQLNWDLGTSPVLTENCVVVAVMHQGPSYLVALDRKTGKEVWKQDRDLGAPAEARDSYSTPRVIDQGGQETIVVLGADFVTAYKAEDGSELWRVGGLNPEARRNFRSIASPVVADGMVIAPYARGDTLQAIRLGGSGDVTDTHVAWKVYTSSDVPTPVAYQGNVYICGDRGDVSCLNIATGDEVWTESLPRNRYVYSASPVIADGNLYVTREDGTTFVLKTGKTAQVIAENSLRENTYATPAMVDGRIYLRTSEYLYCIGQ